MVVRFLEDGLVVLGCKTAFKTTKDGINSPQRATTQSGKAQAHKVGGHTGEDQNQKAELPAHE